MNDGKVIEKEDLGSTRMRARKVRGEVFTGPERRRRWSVEEKLRMLAQSVAPGSSASLACRLHGISSGQLYTWRRQFRTGELTGFAPVLVAPAVDELPAATAPIDPVRLGGGADRPVDGLIEVELRSGIKLRITGAVDAALLRQVLSALS